MNIEDIQQRNLRVETDKAWETSWTRRILIACMTYGVIALYLWFLHVPQFYLHALVPAAGYVFSTLSLPVFKRYWLHYIYKQSGVS